MRQIFWIFKILRNIYFCFFFNVQNWDSQQGRDSCLKINKYYVIFRKFDTYQIAFLMTCQRHYSRHYSRITLTLNGRMNHQFRILVVNNILQAVDTGYSNWYELIEKYVYKKLSNIWYEPQTLENLILA